jgi:hypothetical protein
MPAALTLALWIGAAQAQAEVPPPVAPGAGRSMAPALVHPVAEVRLDWRFDRLTAAEDAPEEERFAHQFTVPRVELGMQAQPNRRFSVRATLNVVESDARSALIPTEADEGARSETRVDDRDPSGWSVRMRDVYADIRPFDSRAFSVRAGVQPTILGSRGWFDTAMDAYYLVGPRTDEVALLAGLVQDRDIGMRVHGALFGDSLQLDAMVANGTGGVAGGEDNKAKDVSARIDLAPVESLHFVASALTAVHGEDGARSDKVMSFLTQWRHDTLRLMGEYLGGQRGFGGSDPIRFIGGQTGAAGEWSMGGGAVDTGVATARVGYFDPVAEETDATAWLTVDASLQGWWKVPAPFGLMHGLGYSMLMPMDATIPVEHSVVLQMLWNR